MGCDGGTIPTRGELVSTKKKPEKVSKDVDLMVKWMHCRISQEPLQPPIVACELGRIYNKESVINYLLDKSVVDNNCPCDHIKGLKDVKELKLTPNPEHSVEADKAGIAGSSQRIARYICPITGLEMNGRYRFCYLYGCGCVFSERALKEIKDGICVKCGKTYTAEDVIPLNGSDEEVEELTERMAKRKLQAKESRKAKRAKSSAAAGSEESLKDGDSVEEGQPPSKLQKTSESQDVGSSDLAAAATTSEADPPASTSKSHSDKTKKSATSSSAGRKADPFAPSKGDPKKSKSIQNDANASAAFKSLFNTHATAKNQMKAHWVTHNPLYY